MLNSYWIGKDGKHYFYEVILVDRASPSVLSDSSLKWIAEGVHRHRAERGKTSAGRKSRGLIRKKGHEKNFPSMRANKRRAK